MPHPPISPTDQLQGHAVAIGWVCIKLAHLELVLDIFIKTAAPIEDSQVGDIITGGADMGQKVQMVKGLGFLRKTSDTWFEELRTELNRIKPLQERRNRFIHDVWVQSSTAPNLLRKRIALKKPQSHQAEQLTTTETVKITVDEIWDLVNDIMDTHSKLMNLLMPMIDMPTFFSAE